MKILLIQCVECKTVSPRTKRSRIAPCTDCGGQVCWVTLDTVKR